jgi:hypothetical protein
MTNLGLVEMFFLLLLGLCAAIWIWALVDCLRYEPAQGNEKLIWIIVIVFTYVIGAILYLLIRRPQRQIQAQRS